MAELTYIRFNLSLGGRERCRTCYRPARLRRDSSRWCSYRRQRRFILYPSFDQQNRQIDSGWSRNLLLLSVGLAHTASVYDHLTGRSLYSFEAVAFDRKSAKN